MPLTKWVVSAYADSCRELRTKMFVISRLMVQSWCSGKGRYRLVSNVAESGITGFLATVKAGHRYRCPSREVKTPYVLALKGHYPPNTYLTFPIGELFQSTPFVQPYRRVSPFHMLKRSSVWSPKRNRLNQNISSARLAVGASL
jgi:hypothetical protein